MRKYAYLKKPIKKNKLENIVKIMLYETEEGVYLFEYSDPDAFQSSSDILYDSLEDLYEDWNPLIDDKGWMEIEDPLPYCQQDTFIPIRVKGRDIGKPKWGEFETLKDGKWVDFKLK